MQDKHNEILGFMICTLDGRTEDHTHGQSAWPFHCRTPGCFVVSHRDGKCPLSVGKIKLAEPANSFIIRFVKMEA
jgi:hypothetical protein